MKIKYICLFLLTSTLFATVNFVDPTSTTGSEIPDLSIEGDVGSYSKIATSANGQYVYVIWTRKNDSSNYYIVQTARSNDYGVTWTDPTTTPSDLGSPNLSLDGEDAYYPTIVTNSSGQYVYAIWKQSSAIKTTRSTDWGNTWENITNLESNPTDALPDITTDSSGVHVYAIWLDSTSIVQTKRSDDFGASWKDKTALSAFIASGFPYFLQISTSSDGQYVYALWNFSTGGPITKQFNRSINSGAAWEGFQDLSEGSPYYLELKHSSNGQYVYISWQESAIKIIKSTNYGAPSSWSSAQNISDAGTFASNFPFLKQRIATSSDGKYLYSTWSISNGSNNITQVKRSDDYATTWYDPTTTPSDLGAPNLSISGSNTIFPKVVCSANGQHVYATWQFGSSVIQSAVSSDLGVTWENPTSTASDLGTPNLSRSSGNATNSFLATSTNGQYIYSIWKLTDALSAIQVTIGTATIPSSMNLFGNQLKVRFPFQIDLINKISWNSINDAIAYKIYTDSNLTNLIANLPANTLEYCDHRIKYGSTKTYYVTYMNSSYVESSAVEITIP